MPTKLQTLLVLAIFILGAFLRLHDLTKISLFSDEVDAGYQAFVYNHCLSDYSGNHLPIHFQSTSDWRTPLYLLSIALVQKFTQATELSTRLPAAIFGILSLPVFYLLCYKLFKKNHTSGIAGMFLMAINPWHIHYSRFGFEVSGMLLCILLGLLFYCYYYQTRRLKYFCLTLLFLLLSIYFYSTAKMFVPLLVLVLLYHSKSTLSLKKLFTLSFVGLLVLLPLALDTLKGHSSYRFSYTNIFSDPTVSTTVNYQRQLYTYEKYGDGIGKFTDFTGKIVYNKPLAWGQKFLDNYLGSFSPNFLVGTGDSNLRHNTTIYGNLHLLDLVLLILGLFVLLKTSTPYKKILITYLLLSPLPFSLTNDSPTPHATRLFIMLPALLFLSTLGLVAILKNKKYRLLLVPPILVLYAAATYAFYVKSTYVYPSLSAPNFHTGVKEALALPFASQTPTTTTWVSNSFEPLLPLLFVL